MKHLATWLLVIAFFAGFALAEQPSTTQRPATAAALAVLQAAEGAKSYTIKLDRPFQVGDEMQLTAKGSEMQRMTVGGRVVAEESHHHSARLLADMKVLAVDKAGRITRMELTVRRFTGTAGGKPVRAIARGSVLLASRGKEQTQIQLKGGRLDEAQQSVLQVAVPISQASDPGDDAIFGTDKKQALRQSWAVNSAKAAAALNSDEMAVKPANVSGTVTLFSQRTLHDAPCLYIKAQSMIKGFSAPLPEGAKVIRSQVSTRMGGYFPIDPALPCFTRDMSMEMRLDVTMPGPDGKATALKLHSVKLIAVKLAPLDRGPKPTTRPVKSDKPGPLAGMKPQFDGEKTTLDLPEAWHCYVLAGGGRYMIFHLKDAGTVAVVDLLAAKIVKQLPNMPEDVRLAAGAKKILLAMPGQKMIQRWDLKTLKREKIAPLPIEDECRLALMGCSGDGPLLLTSRSDARLIDIDTLKPIKTTEKPIGASGRYGYAVDVSAEGKSFAGIVGGISGQAYTLMRVDGTKITKGRFGGTSYAIRFAHPSADGSLMLLRGSEIYDAALRRVSASWLDKSQCYPTVDPKYFLSVRFAPDAAGVTLVRIAICTTGNRKVVHTFNGLKEMAPYGNTRSRSSIEGRLLDGMQWFHYLPGPGLLVAPHYDKRKIIFRKLDMVAELKKGGGYIYVTSVPPSTAAAGGTLQYQITVESSKGGLKYKIESAPDGVGVSDKGLVTWSVDRYFKQDTATIILSITDSGGKEALHTISVKVTNLFRRPKK